MVIRNFHLSFRSINSLSCIIVDLGYLFSKLVL
nr:MAG TPA: hypothetical protein [Caudoviricetes sp.]